MNRQSVFPLIVLVVTMAGCAVGQVPATTTRATPTLSPTASMPVAITPPRATTAVASSAAPSSAPPRSTPEAADPCAGSTADKLATPPVVTLRATDGSAVNGRLGSYTYCDTAADALPPRAASLSSAALTTEVALTVASTSADLITAYRAGYWPASEWQGDEVRYADADLSAPAAAATFTAPPSGDWILSVNLTFASGGDALYYWHVTVP